MLIRTSVYGTRSKFPRLQFTEGESIMEKLALAFVLMCVSAFVSIYIGQRAGKSKTFVYVLGLSTLLAQVMLVTAIGS
jgi:hypothetical protein